VDLRQRVRHCLLKAGSRQTSSAIGKTKQQSQVRQVRFVAFVVVAAVVVFVTVIVAVVIVVGVKFFGQSAKQSNRVKSDRLVSLCCCCCRRFSVVVVVVVVAIDIVMVVAVGVHFFGNLSRHTVQ
jgi:hypothetical protein